MLKAAFWKDAGVRAVKTFAQALVAFIVGAGATDLSLDWPQAVSVAGLAALLSVLTSIGDPNVTGEEPQ